MKVPTSLADAEMPLIEQTRPKLESPQPPSVRRVPLAPVGGWYWLQGKQERTAPQTALPAGRPSIRVLRARCLKSYGRRAMLWVLFWYVAFQIVPTVLKDRWHRIGPHYEQHKWPELEQLVAKYPDRPLVLMVGSSRTAWDFHAGALDGMPDSDGRPMLVYNFGVPTTGPCFQLFCLRDMLAKGIRPRFLLIEFLPPLLCEPKRGYVTEDGMLELESLPLRRMAQWIPYLRNPKKSANLWLETRVAPCYTFRNQLVAEAKSLASGQQLPKHAPIDDRGWHVALPVLDPMVHQNALAAARMGYGQALMNFQLGKAQYRAVRELFELCRREKIPSALVLMPEDSHFRSWYSPEAKTAVRNLLGELKQTYGVECIDAQSWLPDHDFEDGHHALLNGALAFTRRIRNELPRLLAQSDAVK
ncbi:MAG TPA: hypothetical protein VH592_09755 [Gemmataceae bacterium]|jgi:hypothetical protein